ncbi:hypothetical protein HMI54_012947 [Coelomomyces lativittatus]|nr:hypothetical protein HMI54_012947 [Coelomomyces lativittatus]
MPVHIFVLSAKTKSSLSALINNYTLWFEKQLDQTAETKNNNTWNLEDICYTLTIGRANLPYRMAIILQEQQEQRKLQQLYSLLKLSLTHENNTTTPANTQICFNKHKIDSKFNQHKGAGSKETNLAWFICQYAIAQLLIYWGIQPNIVIGKYFSIPEDNH